MLKHINFAEKCFEAVAFMQYTCKHLPIARTTAAELDSRFPLRDLYYETPHPLIGISGKGDFITKTDQTTKLYPAVLIFQSKSYHRLYNRVLLIKTT